MNKNMTTTDAYGLALKAYLEGKKQAKLTVSSDIVDTEKWDVSTFFRNYEQMPEVEKIALERVKGRTLDVGAGAGNHALWLQSKGIDVTAIDISEGAIEVMGRRGVEDSRLVNYFDLKDEKYDTLLLLMNGVGIVEKLERFEQFFFKAKELLNKGGKILLDSSNIIYLFMEEDGSALIDLNANYYGEISYRIDYGKHKGQPFGWIFIDYDTLAAMAVQYGFTIEKIYEDEHYLYLAELTLVD